MNYNTDPEILLGELRAELLTTKRELEEMTARATQAEAQYAESAKNITGYVEEFKKVAAQSQTLLDNLKGHLAAGDAVRNRLAKVTHALAQADALILAIDSKSDTLEGRRADYARSKLELATPDDAHAHEQDTPQR